MTTKRFNLSLTHTQLLAVADALEGYHTHHLTEDELHTHNAVLARVFRAINRADA